MDLDPHVVDHADDVFDLFRLDDAVGQVIVHLGIGQEALFLAFGNQFFEPGLGVLVHGASIGQCCARNASVY